MVSPQDLKSSDNSKIPDLIHKITGVRLLQLFKQFG